MLRDARLLALVIAVMAGTALFGASDASATVLCKTTGSPCTGGAYGKGLVIEASLKEGTESVLHGPLGTVECGAAIKGEVTKSGGEGTTVSGFMTSLSFSNCTGKNTVRALKSGTFSINYTSGGNGTLKLEGFETEVTNSEFGGTCIYSGPISIPLTGGSMASIAVSSVSVPRTGGTLGAFCGSTGSWTAEYTVTSPEPLYVAEKAASSPTPQPILCKTTTDPCSGGIYANGTIFEASLKTGTESKLSTPFGTVKCSSSTMKGEFGNSGEKVALTSLTFGGCNCGVNVVKNGSFTLEATGSGNGALVSSGSETTTSCLEYHCIYATGSTTLGSIQGGAMASLVINSSLPRVGGSSEGECGSTGTWTAEYTVTSPEPLYIAKEIAPRTVLCVTTTNPCSGGIYPKGSMIEAGIKEGTKSVLHNALGKVECEATIKGEMTSAGEVPAISGPVTSLSFSNCAGSNTVKVLKNGTFSISYTSGGNGTLKLEGFETEVINHVAGGTCIYTGSISVTLKGGAMASFATSNTTLSRIGGTLGAFCGSTGNWTAAEYTVTWPEPLYVETI